MPSTAIGTIAYEAATQRLTVEFVTRGRRYDSSGVPFELYDEFRHAFAKGVFFNRRIRGRYRSELVAGAETGAPSAAPLFRP
jgi:hypothetical protein